MLHLIRPIILVLMALATGCATTSSQPSMSQSELEARSAFMKLVEVARSGNSQKFKSMIVPADLVEMESLDKEKPGFFPMFMELIAEGGNPESYKAKVITPDRVTFVRLVVQKTPDLSSKEETTVTMLKIGNRWLLGKPKSHWSS